MNIFIISVCIVIAFMIANIILEKGYNRKQALLLATARAKDTGTPLGAPGSTTSTSTSASN